MFSTRKLLLPIGLAGAVCLGFVPIARADTSGTFAPGQGCSNLAPMPGEVPASGAFNCADGFLSQPGNDPADDVFVLGAYASSPTVRYDSLSDLGYNPATDPPVGVHIMKVTSQKAHDFQMYQNQVALGASLTPEPSAMNIDVEAASFAQCWFTVDDPTQAPGADIALNYNLALGARLDAPPMGFGRPGYIASFSVDDVTGPEPENVAGFGGFVFKFPDSDEPLIAGFDPSDVTCAGNSCTLDATVAGSMAVPNQALISITTNAIGSISVSGSPGGLWSVDANNTSLFTVAIDQSANPNAMLILAASGLVGDYNGDGTVDAADYVVWRKTDGSQEGYSTWRANFGATAGASATAGSPSSPHDAVPEPASLVVLLLAATIELLRRTSSWEKHLPALRPAVRSKAA